MTDLHMHTNTYMLIPGQLTTDLQIGNNLVVITQTSRKGYRLKLDLQDGGDLIYIIEDEVSHGISSKRLGEEILEALGPGTDSQNLRQNIYKALQFHRYAVEGVSIEN
jgi:hypothetical protein